MRRMFTYNSGKKFDRYSQFSVFVLVIIMLTGIFADQIATSKPLYLKYNNRHYFPAITNSVDKDLAARFPGGVDWSKLKSEAVLIQAPVPYDPGISDFDNALYQQPFSKNNNKSLGLGYRHWLGTNLKGDDLLSGIIHGTSVSLKVGVLSITIAMLIGVILGLAAGYYQNNMIRIPLISAILMIAGIPISLFMADLIVFFISHKFFVHDTALLLTGILIYLLAIFTIITVSYLAGRWAQRLFRIRKKIHLQVDSIISKIVEVFTAIPKLMLIVALASILERSVTNIILIIGFCSWPGIARIVRAETLKFRNQDFINAARALGLSNSRIMLHHILPNIAGPLVVSFVFGISGAILIESGLSFLNIGVPENVITWGQLLAEGRRNFNAWWLIVFPGVAIFTTLFCLNIIGERYKTILDPRNKNIL